MKAILSLTGQDARDRNGNINANAFLDAIRGPVNPNREALVAHVFKLLDRSQVETLSYKGEDVCMLLSVFNVKCKTGAHVRLILHVQTIL